MKRSQDYVPKDYEDLYAYYIQGSGNGDSLCHTLIRSYLKYATDDERETLAHDVFLRLMEKKQLENFDPSKANFGGVIFYVTRTICVNHLSRKERNPLTGLNRGSIVEEDEVEEGFEPGTYALSRLFEAEDLDLDGQIDILHALQSLFQWAHALSNTGASKRDRNLLNLLKMMIQERDVQECSQSLGVTTSTIFNWQKYLRIQFYNIVENT